MRRYVGYAVALLFVEVLIAGLTLHEFGAVLANAITVCLSCIGIG